MCIRDRGWVGSKNMDSCPSLVAIHYVLPVVCMTSRLAVVGRVAMRCDPGAESDVYECLVLILCYVQKLSNNLNPIRYFASKFH